MTDAEKIEALCKALEAALEHERHEDGKCGCAWTTRAAETLTKVRAGEGGRS